MSYERVGMGAVSPQQAAAAEPSFMTEAQTALAVAAREPCGEVANGHVEWLEAGVRPEPGCISLGKTRTITVPTWISPEYKTLGGSTGQVFVESAYCCPPTAEEIATQQFWTQAIAAAQQTTSDAAAVTCPSGFVAEQQLICTDRSIQCAEETRKARHENEARGCKQASTDWDGGLETWCCPPAATVIAPPLPTVTTTAPVAAKAAVPWYAWAGGAVLLLWLLVRGRS